ncbi:MULTISPECIES: phosphoribosyltransferase [Stutzerimonas stutzeri subgroup]|uniref:phosphoribosyltransferase n=1 Tax=Stutzerimonas stutzeri subgroup TaxID=578833 RepID=UPI0002548EA0|nr:MULTISPECIES: phosphoribosyltransferase [Stutzerimonas stutzeri subgroup]EHY78033.1 phosphoribosyl transferase domain-containing protein [Stutzerimonas stutzeri ATCC 14405 = CCUG 16156]KRW71592.1 phosphoribosyltransferase [Pseudomonas sp. TTU2014-105ASC]MCQ4254857.1 phosphoribosyltransferase [Stutzerimonas stutzeri]MDH2241721.1 phosphoribosyltransferase [Pseudomonas sp. GD03909]
MTLKIPFPDRVQAGEALAERLAQDGNWQDALVLALPRGGVPVAFEVAQRLGLELDILVVRKLGVPGNPELAMGAIASGGVRVMNDDIVHYIHISKAEIDGTVAQETHELLRRERAYRGDRPRPAIEGRAVILVDDGLATGATMRAAVQAVRKMSAGSVTVAVPVAAPDSVALLEPLAERIVCLYLPHDLYAIGRWYQNFDQTSDRQVMELLQRAWSKGDQPA